MAENNNNNQNPQAAGGQGPGTNPTQEGGSGKLFTEDFVSTLRGEAAGYRTRAKSYESALRKLLGINAQEEIGDLSARIATYQQEQQTAQQKALEAANQRLINAEMQSLSGYDHKLLAKLIDLSKVAVDDNGEVHGLKEAAQAVRTEYPAVFTAPPPFGGRTQGPTEGADTLKDRANSALRSLFGGKD